MENLSRSLRNYVSGAVRGAVLGLGLLGASQVMAETVQVPGPEVTGQIQWGVWVDDDGCMHWWADGGLEGYMLDRVDPKTGKPICLKKNTCLVANTDTLFATDSHKLTADGRRRLTEFFKGAGAFGYAIYGHTDARASDEYNMRLSERRAKSVGDVARSVGAMVERQIGFGERRPVAPNDSAANMQKNRRVEVVCYRW